ncbi:MAG TPA: glycosyltransferase [bacterium]|nr:glycosyltransferase [bacterium]
MKILQVNKFNYLRGGAEKYFLQISEELVKAGHQVAVFSMQHPKNLPSPWEKYFVSRISFNESHLRDWLIAPGRIIYSFSARRKFTKLLNDFKPDIIHIHNIYHQISPSILSVASKHRIPIVMHLHDYKLVCPNYQLFTDNKICYRCWPKKYSQCLKHCCFKNSFFSSLLATIEMEIHHKILKIYEKNISCFIAPSKFMKETLVKFNWAEDKIKVVYNFSEKMDNNLINEVEDYALYFGRLSKEKGINTLLEALQSAKNKINLKIVGSGPEEENLKKLVQELYLEKQVEFLGFKSDQALYDIVKKAKIIFIPSIWNENMPFALIEALSLKKVVAVSKVGGLQELIEDRVNGFLFKPGDLNDIADIINNLSNYDLNLMGEKAYQISRELDINNHLIKILEIYNKLIKN